LELSEVFLKQLVATDPQAIHIIFWDQAGFHPKPQASSLPPQVRLVELPAYSPELNPIEPLWDRVKEAVSNQVWETLSAIESEITQVLRGFWESPERVWSLLGDHELTQGIRTYLQLRQIFI
jgi:transposase